MRARVTPNVLSTSLAEVLVSDSANNKLSDIER
jgi:hypothetical protein